MAQERKVIIKTPQQIANIRESWNFLTELLYKLYDMVQPGVMLVELEKYAQNYLDQRQLRGAFKWYQWFPANLCLSVNDCVVHGIPDQYMLKTWDLLKIDCGVWYKWGISDAAISVVVWGEFANPQAFSLVEATKTALDKGIKHIKANESLFAYSSMVYQQVKQYGFTVIENLTGHGVGELVHEAPHIYNFPHASMKKERLVPNMVIALEPITALRSTLTVERPNNRWNLYTKFSDLGAQWEYTLLVTEKGYEILAGVTEDIF